MSDYHGQIHADVYERRPESNAALEFQLSQMIVVWSRTQGLPVLLTPAVEVDK